MEEIKACKQEIIFNLLETLLPQGILIATIDYTWLDPLLSLCGHGDEYLQKSLRSFKQRGAFCYPYPIDIDIKDLEFFKHNFGTPNLFPAEIYDKTKSDLTFIPTLAGDAILNGFNSVETNKTCSLLSSLLLIIKRIF